MNTLDKLRQSINRVKDWLKPTPLAWSGAADGITALGLVVVLVYFYFSGVADFAVQKIPALLVWLLLPIALGSGLLFAASLVMGLPTRLRWVLAIVAPLMLLSVFPGGDQTGFIAGSLVVVCFGLIGAGSGVLLQGGQRDSQRRAAGIYLALGVFGLSYALYAVFSEKEIANPALADYVLEDKTLNLPNPSLPGSYTVKTLTYGSGRDLRRDDYGENVTVVSRTVDGSKLIDNWDGLSGWLRTSYWGFDVTELPLQARVWMPEGVGPFPLVLVVHGNHGMEDFSDPGYDYLGELFASRGIILASVDENFINSSYSARVNIFADRPGLREENDARGWLLLEHLAQFRDWNEEAGHLFFDKIDMERLALIGHSRGGEAVGIAAAFNKLEYYPDDASQVFNFDFNLRGVIAIAPVYGQYEPRSRPTPVTDVNYFTIHGDMDGDVQSFEGAAQYSRVNFSGDEYKFRSSLYVVGANHGQFNTTWENLDTGRFYAWSLDLSRIMPRDAQRTVAKVYFSAFLESVFNDNKDYLPLFKDARFGSQWLPNTFYINQFSDSEERVIVDFEHDLDLTTLDNGRGEITTENMTRWYEVGNKLKYDELDTHSVVLAWDKGVTGNDAQPSVSFSVGNLFTGVGQQSLVLSLSASDISTKPTGWKEDQGSQEEDDLPPADQEDTNDLLDWTIELTDAAGNIATAPLSIDSELYPLVKAIPGRAEFLDNTEPTEILFRRFSLPLASFNSDSSDFNATWLSRIRFLFERSSKGAIILDNISLSPN
jgi:dienelactone hydrolase